MFKLNPLKTADENFKDLVAKTIPVYGSKQNLEFSNPVVISEEKASDKDQIVLNTEVTVTDPETHISRKIKYQRIDLEAFFAFCTSVGFSEFRDIPSNVEQVTQITIIKDILKTKYFMLVDELTVTVEDQTVTVTANENSKIYVGNYTPEVDFAD